MSPTYGYSPSWGATPTFSVPGYTPPPSVTPRLAPSQYSFPNPFGPGGATGYTASLFPTVKSGGTTAGGFALTPASYGPPPTEIPVGKVSNWKDFVQGLLGTGVQYILQKDAQKRADKLQQQGVDVQVVPNPGGGYSVQERPSFLKSPAGIALILGGGALVVYLMTRKR